MEMNSDTNGWPPGDQRPIPSSGRPEVATKLEMNADLLNRVEKYLDSEVGTSAYRIEASGLYPSSWKLIGSDPIQTRRNHFISIGQNYHEAAKSAVKAKLPEKTPLREVYDHEHQLAVISWESD